MRKSLVTRKSDRISKLSDTEDGMARG